MEFGLAKQTQDDDHDSKMFAQPRPRKSALVPPPKKRKTTHAIEEITFDKDARQEYLSGFHKRKQARIKHAQELAEQRAREERIEMRKQVWEARICIGVPVFLRTDPSATDQGRTEAGGRGPRPGHQQDPAGGRARRHGRPEPERLRRRMGRLVRH